MFVLQEVSEVEKYTLEEICRENMTKVTIDLMHADIPDEDLQTQIKICLVKHALLKGIRIQQERDVMEAC